MKESVIALYSVYKEALESVKEAKANLAEAEEALSLVKSSLAAAISPNTSKDGVFFKRVERRSVSYSKALSEIRSALIPKTRQGEVDRIISENTSISYIDSFEALK